MHQVSGKTAISEGKEGTSKYFLKKTLHQEKT